jgi:hypothetical protein
MAIAGMILCSLFLVAVWGSEIQTKLSHWKSRR